MPALDSTFTPPKLDTTLNSTLTRPKLDATLVIEPGPEGEQEGGKQQNCPLFALASLNTRTAPSAEVRWSQLLALSLAPEDEPILTVGRAKDCGVQLSDPRASTRHFEILAHRLTAAGGQDGAVGATQGLDASASLGALTPGPWTYECYLKDRSSNGTTVNGTIVGKGKSTQLRTGDEISVLPESRVGADDVIAFIFRNNTESLAAGVGSAASSAPAEQKRSLELEELVVCPICMQAIYKCVALTPCSHNFCMACVSEWLSKKRSDCPVCRRPISAVMKNHPMDAVIEAFLDVSPQWQRSEEERQAMDARDELRLGPSGKWVRDLCSVGTSTAVGSPTGPPGGAPANAASAARGGEVGRPPPRAPSTSGGAGSQICVVQ
jgi:hypothetical protein